MKLYLKRVKINLFVSLKNIVEYLESCVVDDENRACKGKGVVFHCVQGKDR